LWEGKKRVPRGKILLTIRGEKTRLASYAGGSGHQKTYHSTINEIKPRGVDEWIRLVDRKAGTMKESDSTSFLRRQRDFEESRDSAQGEKKESNRKPLEGV